MTSDNNDSSYEISSHSTGSHRANSRQERMRKHTQNSYRSLGDAPPASGLGTLSNPTKPPRKIDQRLTTKRMVTAGLLLPLFMLIFLPLTLTGTLDDVHPRHMDVAIIGSETDVQKQTDDLDHQTAGSFDVHRVDNVDDAKNQINERQVRAAYNPAEGKLYLAGANGKQVNSAVTQLFTPVAQQSHQEMQTEDIQPVHEEDPSGTSAVYLALGAILGGFMSGMILGLLPVDSKLRLILGVAMPVIIATAEIIIGWAVFGIFDGSAMGTWGILYLLSFSCLAVTLGGMLAIGPAMLPISIFLTSLLGMATSGVTAPLDMVHAFYAGIHPWLFSSQGIEAVKNSIYFQDMSFVQPIWVMLIWAVVGIVLAVFGTVRQKRRHLFATMSEMEEAQFMMAVGAVAP